MVTLTCLIPHSAATNIIKMFAGGHFLVENYHNPYILTVIYHLMIQEYDNCAPGHNFSWFNNSNYEGENIARSFKYK